jgi:hypothetical protein
VTRLTPVTRASLETTKGRRVAATAFPLSDRVGRDDQEARSSRIMIPGACIQVEPLSGE